MAELLVGQGADPDALDDRQLADREGVTALRHAQLLGHRELAALLT